MSLTHGGGLVFIADSGDTPASTVETITFKLEGRADGLPLRLSLRPKSAGTSGRGKHASRKSTAGYRDASQEMVATPDVDRAALAQMFPAKVAPARKLARRSPALPETPSATPPSSEALMSEILFYSRLPVSAPASAGAPDEATLDALGEALTAYVPSLPVTQPPMGGIPVAYTYFGQFLAHDMSFLSWDPTLDGVGGWHNAQALHALDFGSLFGTRPETGPRSSPWEERAEGALGLAAFAPPGLQRAYDLPRAGAGGKHCCPDTRTDTNLALAQMHVLLARFHQQASIDLGASTNVSKQTTRRHLQAVVLTDYLKRIIPDAIYQDVMTTGRKFVHTGGGVFLIPIEFAAACFRFGHSMVGESYVHWSINYPPGSGFALQTADLSTLAHYTETGGGLLNGCQPFTWCQAWRHMVDNSNPDLPATLMARPIQASLAPMFRELDHKQFPDTKAPATTGTFNLAKKTLRRGRDFDLPSGQSLALALGLAPTFDIAAFMNVRRARFGPLADDLALTSNTPLWFYILAEAEDQANSKLGPLAARIVMETFHAALETAEDSILSVAPTGATCNNFKRKLRLTSGPPDEFKLSDVVAVANGDVM